ncbi:unnamed protein product [Rotaria sordida]|uniref:Carrier domain-containing protein n=1 Tax=Rotaria sordida TaxID=392033 RepID=A0A815B4H6_9BILA|nr:unnamed protein product [Rotaria sordida]
MCQHQVTFTNLVPSLAIALIDYLSRLKQRFSPSLRIVISTGEPLSWTLASELLECLSPNTHLLNTYGVTETTVDCTYRRVFEHDSVLSSLSTFVPVGVPLPNYVCHIIEEEGEEDGVGELFIGGPGVFQGYLNQGPNPDDSRLAKINEDICYRTGDLVKVVNGELAYVGRRDFQVKIRGQRIETGEIEAVILRHCREQLNACVVIAYDNHLIAYVQTRSSGTDVERIVNETCRQHLPINMLPFAIVVLDRFPLNANGKVDRACLPPPLSPKVSLSTDGEPQNELEFYLHGLWCRMLGIDRVPRDINLYTLGANSLHFMLAANDYHRQLRTKNAQLDLSTFIRHATIAQHAEILLTKQNQTIITPVWQSERLTEGPSSLEQEAIWLDEQMRFRSDKDGIAVYHIVLTFRILTIDGKSQLVTSRLRSSLQLLVEKHASLRTCLEMSDDDQSELRQRILPSNSTEVPLVEIKSDSLSHILFTSGSTGEPKAIQLSHRNFVSYTRSAVIDSTSIVLHHRSVAFDPHLEEIAGSLISGAQVVLLKPDPCHLDMDYFSTTIARYQVTFIGIVPTALITMINLIRSLPQVEQDNRLKSLRCIVSGGIR